jgi:hypothetical protein
MDDRMERLTQLERRVDAISDGVSMAAPKDPKGKGLAGLDVRIDHLRSHGAHLLALLTLALHTHTPVESVVPFGTAGRSPLFASAIRDSSDPERCGRHGVYGYAEGRDASYFQRTETSTAFRDEYERHKQQTDADLDDISLGLNALKEIAGSMGEVRTSHLTELSPGACVRVCVRESRWVAPGWLGGTLAGCGDSGHSHVAHAC